MNLNQVTPPTVDLERAAAFYRALGLVQIVSSPPRYARFECPDGGATLSLHLVTSPPQQPGAVVYFECADLDERYRSLRVQSGYDGNKVGGQMLFALDQDDGTLMAFESAAQAAAHCKAVDVQDGYWRFFADDGSPLDAHFAPQAEAPEASVPQAFTLERAMSGLWLQERLGQVATVSGCGLETVDDLEETLKVNRAKRPGINPIRR